MRIHPSLKSWVGIVTRKMPHLSKPQAVVLAMLSWILSQWQPGEEKLALAIDATTLGQRFTVLAKACFRSR